ncbi:MAG: DNA mismatch repair protein MutS, partial [Lachnospiraceae bacterium]|nr:DNA mismatch repair protein MutS [Lachnospiraceae bacterium]
MMKQYMETKKTYPDCILFYRLGDFYEMFFEDAITASRELEITLTGKSCGLEERAPMCGVPYHAVDGYLNKLVKRGYKVAICEQMEDPKLTKGLVKREVTRIVTPGTNIDMQALEESRNNYLMCIAYEPDGIGLATIDISTGDYYVTELQNDRQLFDEINRFMPSEIVCNDGFMVSGFDLEDLKSRLGITLYHLEAWYFDDETCQKVLLEHFNVSSLVGLGIADFKSGLLAAGAVMSYLYETQKSSLSQITRLLPYTASKFMLLDSSTRRNLELTETLREKQKRGSLLWVLDKTRTAMGARTLRSYLEQPLIDRELIIQRLDAIEQLNEQMVNRDEL